MTSRFAKFMNLKDFHPSNYQNQKKVWIAREREKQKQKEIEQLDREYQKEHGLLTVKYVGKYAELVDGRAGHRACELRNDRQRCVSAGRLRRHPTRTSLPSALCTTSPLASLKVIEYATA
jgi:hypothetical protein